MWRLVALLLLLALMAAGAAWLSLHPGDIRASWLDYEIEGTVAGALGLLLLLWTASLLLAEAALVLFRLPRRLRLRREISRIRRALAELTAGFAALESGEHEQARKAAQRAGSLLPGHDLPRLLAAGAAERGRDDASARRNFTALLESPQARLAGLEGLGRIAAREGDTATALDLAEQAFRTRPDHPETVRHLLDLYKLRERWGEAQLLLEREIARRRWPWARHRADLPAMRRERAEMLAARAEAYFKSGKLEEADALSAEALRFLPDSVSLLSLRSDVLVLDGRRKDALALIERAWKNVTHQDLSSRYADILAPEGKKEKRRRAKKILARKPSAPESRELAERLGAIT